MYGDFRKGKKKKREGKGLRICWVVRSKKKRGGVPNSAFGSSSEAPGEKKRERDDVIGA